MPDMNTEAKGRRISLDLTPAASAEVDKLKRSTGVTTAELFRYAFSLLRIYVQAKEDGQEIRIVSPGATGTQTRLELPIEIAPRGEQ